MERVKLFEKKLTLPAYEMRDDYREPSFCGHGVNNRSIYPYTYQGSLTRKKISRTFRAIILENEFLRITVLPELGGRIHSVFDKKKNSEMFYNPGVIKPSLIALRGAWICGGMEFNSAVIGHSVTTMSPLNFIKTEKTRSGASVTVGDIEHNFRTEWRVKITLRAGAPYFGTSISVNNPNPHPAPCYFWSNAALPCNDYVQIFYPAKKISIGWAGALDYPVNRGTDMSWLRNYINPSDTYGIGIEKDWFAIYDHERGAGVVHIADRKKCRGRKMFTWGRSDDRNTWIDRLSDNSTLYIEMQSGMLETQHETSLIGPGKTISWDEKWYPFWSAPPRVISEIKNYYIKSFRRGKKKKPARKAPARKEPGLIEEGERAFRNGFDGDAEIKFKKAAGKKGLSAKALLWLGIIYMKQGLAEKSGKMFRACLKKDEYNSEAKRYLDILSGKRAFKPGYLWDNASELRQFGNDSVSELCLELASRRLKVKEYGRARYVLMDYLSSLKPEARINPMAYYYLASITDSREGAREYCRFAASLSPDHVFPHRVEEIEILRKAVKLNPRDPAPRYYLGNLLYHKGMVGEAIKEWKASEKSGFVYPILFRNLGYALWKQRNRKKAAKEYYLKAIALDPYSLQTSFELDDLCRVTRDRRTALAAFKKMPESMKRNEFIGKRIARWHIKRDPDKAIKLLRETDFYFPFEGERVVVNMLQRAYFNRLRRSRN